MSLMAEAKENTLGILGGGQLARMMVLAGTPLGVRFRIVDPATDACAGQIAPLLGVDWNALDALEPFAREIDAATFDFENVPAATAEWLTAHTRVAPNALSLATAQDRVLEKTLFRECGLPTTEFANVATRADLDAALARIGAPAAARPRLPAGRCARTTGASTAASRARSASPSWRPRASSRPRMSSSSQGAASTRLRPLANCAWSQ